MTLHHIPCCQTAMRAAARQQQWGPYYAARQRWTELEGKKRRRPEKENATIGAPQADAREDGHLF